MIEKCDVSAHQEVSPCLGDRRSRPRARIADHSHRPSFLRLPALSTDVVPAPPYPIVQNGHFSPASAAPPRHVRRPPVLAGAAPPALTAVGSSWLRGIDPAKGCQWRHAGTATSPRGLR